VNLSIELCYFQQIPFFQTILKVVMFILLEFRQMNTVNNYQKNVDSD